MGPHLRLENVDTYGEVCFVSLCIFLLVLQLCGKFRLCLPSIMYMLIVV